MHRADNRTRDGYLLPEITGVEDETHDLIVMSKMVFNLTSYSGVEAVKGDDGQWRVLLKGPQVVEVFSPSEKEALTTMAMYVAGLKSSRVVLMFVGVGVGGGLNFRMY